MGRKDEPRVLKLINFEIWNIQKFNELLLNCWKYLSIDCWNALYLIQLSLEYSRSRDPLHLHLHHHEITREGSLDCGGHAMSGLVKYHFSSRTANWLSSYLSVEVKIRQHFSSSKVNTELTVLRSKENISTEWSESVECSPTVVSSTLSPNLYSIVTDLTVASVVMENLSKVFSDLSLSVYTTSLTSRLSYCHCWRCELSQFSQWSRYPQSLQIFIKMFAFLKLPGAEESFHRKE